MNKFLFLLCCLVPLAMSGQEDFRNYDYIYSSHIKSVTCRPSIRTNGFPKIHLGSNDKLVITFDDLDGDFVYYRYRIVQCDMNWEPSQLNEIQYIDGFNDQEIREFEFSSTTRQSYTQYRFTFPNENISVNKSGNYLLHVYREDDHQPIITKRFVVAELLFNERSFINSDMNAGNRETNQLIKTEVIPTLPMTDPLNQVSVRIIQNGNWDISIMMKPRFQRADFLSFDYLDKSSFPGMKDFRPLDLRSLRRPSFQVENLERFDNRTEVFLKTDRMRTGHGNATFPDLNGGFIIDDLDNFSNTLSNDYSLVHFYLHSPGKLAHPVYFIGAFNNWGHDSDVMPMTYDAENQYYTGQAYLKQGYYDYMYVEKLPDGNMSHQQTENNSFETPNNYQVIVYFKGYGELYDRVVSYRELGQPTGGISKD